MTILLSNASNWQFEMYFTLQVTSRTILIYLPSTVLKDLISAVSMVTCVESDQAAVVGQPQQMASVGRSLSKSSYTKDNFHDMIQSRVTTIIISIKIVIIIIINPDLSIITVGGQILRVDVPTEKEPQCGQHGHRVVRHTRQSSRWEIKMP